ncbi:MAG: hypothetical protein WC702_04370 [Patescibacteria group bacterium]|jgi:hypothetical protein
MFQSQDILFIVLAFCALWVTAFMCWLIWQIAMILKNVNDTMAEAREKMAKIEEAITGIRGKFEKATMGLSFLVDSIRKVVEYAIDKKQEKKSKKIADFDD